jgi:hypothetical protein
VVLGEVADGRLVAPDDLTSVGLELTDEHLQSVVLPTPLLADDGDLLALGDEGVEALADGLVRARSSRGPRW